MNDMKRWIFGIAYFTLLCTHIMAFELIAKDMVSAAPTYNKGLSFGLLFVGAIGIVVYTYKVLCITFKNKI